MVSNNILYCTQFTNQQLTRIRAIALMNQPTIAESAFACNFLLKFVHAPNTHTIGAQAFQCCCYLSALRSDCLRSIGMGAFYGCSALTAVSLENVVEIGASAFYRCSSLVGASLGALKSKVPANCFRLCESLKFLKV